MPGREGSGPLGGSTGSGGSSGGGGFGGGGTNLGNIGGGLLRGVGSFGSGLRPGGFGIPSLFGPRFGGGGLGCGGCGCILLILVVVACIVLGVLFGGLGRLFGGFNSAISGSNIISGNNPINGNTNIGGNSGSTGNGGGLANQPPSVQTQTAIDLTELHGALDSRIPGWQSAVGNNQEQHVSASDAGMGNDNNIKDVVYGKCGSDFYVFVVDKGVPNNASGANGSGYAYTSASSPATCHPSEYSVTDWENDGNGWYFVYLRS